MNKNKFKALYSVLFFLTHFKGELKNLRPTKRQGLTDSCEHMFALRLIMESSCR